MTASNPLAAIVAQGRSHMRPVVKSRLGSSGAMLYILPVNSAAGFGSQPFSFTVRADGFPSCRPAPPANRPHAGHMVRGVNSCVPLTERTHNEPR